MREQQEATLSLVEDLNLYAGMPGFPPAKAELEFKAHRIVAVRAEDRHVELIDADLFHPAVDPQPQKREQLRKNCRIIKSDNHSPQSGYTGRRAPRKLQSQSGASISIVYPPLGD